MATCPTKVSQTEIRTRVPVSTLCLSIPPALDTWNATWHSGIHWSFTVWTTACMRRGGSQSLGLGKVQQSSRSSPHHEAYAQVRSSPSQSAALPSPRYRSADDSKESEGTNQTGTSLRRARGGKTVQVGPTDCGKPGVSHRLETTV